MLTHPAEKFLAKEVAQKVHAKKFVEAAEQINAFFEIGLKVKDEKGSYLPPIQNYLHNLLNYGGTEEAAQILWTPAQFSPHPESVKQIWDLFEKHPLGLIMSGASMGKSYSMGVRLMLEWLRDPEFTSVQVIGPSESHLERNLFSHLVSLHGRASLPMPGEIGELFIGLNRRNQFSSIKGVVIPIGKVKKAGRLQGTKRQPRPEPHPIFGPLTRLFIFIDEFENVPAGIWSDLDNIMSQVGEEGDKGFRLLGAYNPTNQTDEVGKRAEPPFGWENFDPDKHFRWKSTRGWEVLRLDGERCENVVQKKIIYPGLQTREGLERIAKNAGGTQGAGYFSQGRGCYPPGGIELVVIPAGMLPKMRGEYIWYDSPVPVAGADLALEGGDTICFALGKWGRASGIKFPPNIDHPNGWKLMFKDRSGTNILRYGLQADQLFSVPKGDTSHVKTQLIELCRKAGVRPEYFACDRTGNGAGVADLIKYEWSSAIHDVNFSEASSKDKIMLEDSRPCNEQFERLNSELWFALRSWGEFQYFLFNPAIDMTKLTQQVTQRRFRLTGAKSRIESKADYKSRGFESPNEADAITLLVHAARRGSGISLSMRLDESANYSGSPGDEEFGNEVHYKGGARIDEGNRFDYLEESIL